MKDFPLETVKAVRTFVTELKSKETPPDEKICQNYYAALAKHVKFEHERIGGKNWVVSEVVHSRIGRDLIKNILGPKCFFITLSLSLETKIQRLENRYKHFNEEQRKTMIDYQLKKESTFEPATTDEKNAKHIVVTPDLDQNAVVLKILEVIKSFE